MIQLIQVIQVVSRWYLGGSPGVTGVTGVSGDRADSPGVGEGGSNIFLDHTLQLVRVVKCQN